MHPPTLPIVAQVFVNAPSTSPLSPDSPSRGDSDFPILSFYQFSTMDVASAVDYSKDTEANDKVVDTPSMFASPFHNENRSQRGHLTIQILGPKCPRSSMRFCMDQPLKFPSSRLSLSF